MDIRLAREQDLPQLLELYLYLHETQAPAVDDKVQKVWQEMLLDPKLYVLVGEEEGRLLSSCTLTVVPNLTRGQRPYGLVENVVTHGDARGRGLATRILGRARELAVEQDCYKLMLMTGQQAGEHPPLLRESRLQPGGQDGLCPVAVNGRGAAGRGYGTIAYWPNQWAAMPKAMERFSESISWLWRIRTLSP